MGYILEIATGQRHSLRAHHTFGRGVEKVDTPVSDSTISRIHAALEWDGEHWCVRDLSRNGTWRNGARLVAAESALLAAGDILRFGDADGPTWCLEDASEPRSCFTALSAGAVDIDFEPYLFLPDEHTPELVVHYSGFRRRWVASPVGNAAEHPPEHELKHGESLDVGEHRWRVFLAETANVTEMSAPLYARLADFDFVFDLSLDEEHTRLKLVNDGQEINLGERSHHYLLLQLARHRAEQASAGVESSSIGWVEREHLAQELGVDISHLNILIFRARKQIAESLAVTVNSAELVEGQKGRVRFGCPVFRINKGEELTHQQRAD
jgi:hypothetical protein